MSLNTPNIPDPPMNHLEADLLPLMADLDRLGAADRAAAPRGLEARLMQATLAPLHGVQQVSAQVAELASIDRAAAGRDLEEGVYQASVPALIENAPVPRLVFHAAGADRSAERHIRSSRQAWWTRSPVRLAASITFIAGAAIAVWFGNPTTPSKPSPDNMSERVKGEMDTLFAAMETRPSADNASDTTTDPDADDLTKWLLEGSAS